LIGKTLLLLHFLDNCSFQEASIPVNLWSKYSNVSNRKNKEGGRSDVLNASISFKLIIDYFFLAYHPSQESLIDIQIIKSKSNSKESVFGLLHLGFK